MTDQETVMLIETEQRCKSNTHRIDNLENELKEIQSEQKAIYKIATSVELIAATLKRRWTTQTVKSMHRRKLGRKPSVSCRKRSMMLRTNRTSRLPAM